MTACYALPLPLKEGSDIANNSSWFWKSFGKDDIAIVPFYYPHMKGQPCEPIECDAIWDFFLKLIYLGRICLFLLGNLDEVFTIGEGLWVIFERYQYITEKEVMHLNCVEHIMSYLCIQDDFDNVLMLYPLK